LKSCAEELAPVISHIFQLNLETGSLPTDWRNANISPIFKKGDKHTGGGGQSSPFSHPSSPFSHRKNKSPYEKKVKQKFCSF
jgi:hypothetical protein